MNNLKNVFIATILLSIGTIFNDQNYTAYTQEEPTSLETLVTSEEPIVTKSAPATQEEITKKTELQQWNEQLDKLKIATEQWNSTDNVPVQNWTTEAVAYAKNALAQDKTVAETLKSAFFDAISAKIDLEKGKFSEKTFALIIEFNEAIDAKLKEMEESATKTQETAKQTILEEPQPEPVVVQEPLSVTTTPTPITEEISQTDMPTSDSSQNLRTEWHNQLYKIATEGTTLSDTKNLLSKAYELAGQLLSSQLGYPEELQFDFEDALTERTFNKRERYTNLFAINFSDAMEAFSQSTGIQMPTYGQQTQQFDQSGNQTSAQQHSITEQDNMQNAFQELRNEMAIKETFTKAEHEREGASQMIAQKALADLHKHELTAKTQAMEIKFQQKIAQMKAETEIKLNKFAENIKRMATEQKTMAEKGIVATIMDWWSGASKTQEQAQALEKQQEDFFNTMANTQADPNKQNEIKKALHALQNILVTFVTPAFWNQQNTLSEQNWKNLIQEKINIIKENLNIVVNKYNLMPLSDGCKIVTNVISSASFINSENRKKIINEVKSFLEKEEWENSKAEREDIARKEQQILQRKKRKEEKLRAQQNIKDEEDRKEHERQQQSLFINSYKQEQSQWRNLLAQISQNKQATVEKNKAYTREALNQSQSLLNLAHQMPSKNKAALSQKLKQEFSVALLSQQKDNANPINIHQNMDLFNKEINRMVE